jgi:hypothetical protein
VEVEEALVIVDVNAEGVPVGPLAPEVVAVTVEEVVGSAITVWDEGGSEGLGGLAPTSM